MDVIEVTKNLINSLIRNLFGLDGIEFLVEFSKKSEFGDLSTNIAFVLSKTLKKDPKEIASKIIKNLESHNYVVKKAEFLRGFINISMKNTVWEQLLNSINTGDFKCKDIGHGKKVNIEFVSANPTGPLHIGHIRGAVIFDTLSEILRKSGFDVTKEYYINDAGNQIDILIRSIYLRYTELVNDTELRGFPEECYPGEYIKDFAKKIREMHGDALINLDQEDFKNKVKNSAIKYMMGLIIKDLSRLNIFYDVLTSESTLHENEYLEKSLDLLKEKKLLSHEVLDKPKNKDREWLPRKQLVFLAKRFGDSENRSLQKSDGSYTYFASDLAYHLHKIDRGFMNMIVGLGADHAGYVTRLKSAVSGLSNGKARICVKLYNTVNIYNNGEQVKLSKRSGNIVTLDDLTKEGIGAEEVRFAMLMRSSNMVLDFDIAKFIEDSYDNPIFYVQYASTRASSVLNKYNKAVEKCDASLLTTDEELALIKVLAKLPDVLKNVAISYDIHKIAFYLQEIAERFHSLWNLGMKDKDFRFIIEKDKNLTESRLFLVRATKITISNVLSLMKIVPVTHM